ncbi:hypothetical protein F5884DRAFT_887363 [Xylogone sp. PMI_703]|nr:hypothetical protein F5884DRAFT_887363 [Xylogone sp. PMI_703]
MKYQNPRTSHPQSDDQIVDGRYVDPVKLAEMLDRKFGKGNYVVEMRHNKFIIRARELLTEAFDLSTNTHYIRPLLIPVVHRIYINTAAIFVKSTKLMPSNYDIAADNGDKAVERALHTKHVTPGRLSKELKDLLGGNEFQVEMRHNVYTIKSSKPFDVEKLLDRCKGPATGMNFESLPAALHRPVGSV